MSKQANLIRSFPVLTEQPLHDSPRLQNAIMELGIKYIHTNDPQVVSLLKTVILDEGIGKDTRIYAYVNYLSVTNRPFHERPSAEQIVKLSMDEIISDLRSSDTPNQKSLTRPMFSRTNLFCKKELAEVPREDSASLLKSILQLAVDFTKSNNLEVAFLLEDVVKDDSLSASTRQIALSSWLNVMSVPVDRRPSAADCETFNFNEFNFNEWYQQSRP